MKYIIGWFFSAILAAVLTPFAFAQQNQVVSQVVLDEVLSEAGDFDDEIEGEIVVTGSRLRRGTYSSISPLQVISGEVSREVGLVDATDILQQSSAASGAQIDLTFGGFVLKDGPGATNLNLRSLGSNRTLLLLNGKRMAPAGVEGVPSNADLNLIPTSMIDRVELLLDGASSIYGSDAVAGVSNVILRKDFDGFEIGGHTRKSSHSAGDRYQLKLTWGKNWDRGFVGVGHEFDKALPTTLDDVPWTRGCARHQEITEDGQTRHRDMFYPLVFDMRWDDCISGPLAGVVFIEGIAAGGIYYTHGYSNGGWGNFSESDWSVPHRGLFGVDGDGDGQTDVSFRDYDLNGREKFRHLYPDHESSSTVAYGEYAFEGETNLTAYFEVLYSIRNTFLNTGASQLFPDVPADNPFNLCNPSAQGGVDCDEAQNELLTNPNFVRQYQQVGDCDLTRTNCDNLLKQPTGRSYPTLPIVAVRGDRNNVDVRVKQLRMLAGFNMDLPFMNVGSMSDWNLDVSYSRTRSDGRASRLGIRNDRLNHALGVNSSTNTPCVNDSGNPLDAADTATGCVPVNMFASSLYVGVIGDFATPEERNYLFGSHDFDTEYVQAIFQAFANGTAFSLPGGDAIAGIGLEWRNDEINSLPNHVARNGLLFGFSGDEGAKGNKDTKEAYAEIELPIMGNRLMVHEFTANASVRWTDDELYGSQITYQAKLGYRPVPYLLLRATKGSSFRAPNLREVFLINQTGSLDVFDPCLIPDNALDANHNYLMGMEMRDPIILANCLAQGVDPRVAHNNGFNRYSVKVSARGEPNLKAEESDAHSVGFAWEQPFTTAFDFSFGMTYYDIEIGNAIIEPSAQFIVNDCYGSANMASIFCSRITRGDDPNMQPLLTLLDRGFLNQDTEKVRGVDINITYDDTWTIYGHPIEMSMEARASHTKSRTTLFIDDQGNRDFNQYAGEWYVPAWKGDMTIRASWDKWRFTWRTNYIGSVQEDPAVIDDFANILSRFRSDTCLGPGFDDVNCRDYTEADDYMYHRASVSYVVDDHWEVTLGIENVTDNGPPSVDSTTQVATANNTPLGMSYHLLGRTYYLNFNYEPGGF